ncbi:hypothetical protein [Kitasatospora sp. NPDC094015]|uniref:hypothetical protein n=1 Tax=Kitasatospora sp. NPDC094015 TaxID=3155205 RepID=UPI00332C133E
MIERRGVPLRAGQVEEGELYELLMNSAALKPQMEAARRLIFNSLRVREWMIENGFVDLVEKPDGRCAVILLDRAMEYVDGCIARHEGIPGLTRSEYAVICVAANISGARTSLRYILPDLDRADMEAVAEAMMYAAGFMDGLADAAGNEPADGSELGPNSADFDRRLGM